MKVLIGCKRGNVADRDKHGHCLCQECKDYRYQKQQSNPNRKRYTKEWRKKNRSKVSGYVKKWNDKNKERRRIIEEAWKSKNKEKVRLYNAKAGKKWATNNKGKRNAIDMKRRASIIQRTPKWADLEKIKSLYVEAARRTKETGIPHEVDHVMPLQGKNSSGLHVHYNLQILTRSKNRSKGNKVIA